MFTHLLRNRNKFARRLSGLAIVFAAVIMTTASVSANGSNCFQVRGHYDEHIAGEGQFAGTFRGAIKGDFATTVIPPFPIINPPVNNVALFYANTVLYAKVHGKQGDLLIANAGAVQLTGDGNIVDVQIITGGTGELTGATGTIRASGLFDFSAGEGSSEYEGMICLP